MGFKIKHLSKYWRWVKNEKVSYNDNKMVSKEYAKLCLDFDIAMLLNKSEADIDEKASRKHEWVLRYIENACSETVEKYRAMEPTVQLK